MDNPIQCLQLERLIYAAQTREELHEAKTLIRELRDTGRLRHFGQLNNEIIASRIARKYAEINGMLRNKSCGESFNSVMSSLEKGAFR